MNTVNIKVNTKELLNKLNKITKIKIDKDMSTVDKSSLGLKFSLRNNELTIIYIQSYDLCMCATLKTLENSQLELDFYMNKENLLKVLKNFKDETTFSIKDHKIIVTDGTRKLQEIKKEENHQMIHFFKNVGDFHDTMEVRNDFTRELLKHLEYPSQNDNRPVLKGFYLKDNRIYTTDSYKLCFTEFKDYSFKECIITSKVIDLLSKSKETVKNISYFEGMANIKYAKFECEDIIILTVQINGGYPNVERLIPTDFTLSQDFNTKELTNNFKELKSLSSENTVINMNFNDKTLNKRMTDSNYSLALDVKQNNFEIAFDIKHMLPFLKNADQDFSMNFNGELKPIILKDGSPTASLVLPCRTY